MAHPSIIGEHWKLRALRASRSDQLMAAVVRVMVGQSAAVVLPGFAPKFLITEDGLLVGIQVDSNGSVIPNVVICDTDDMRSNLNRLADHIKATDAERKQMFDEFGKTILHDMRTIVDPEDPLSRVQKTLS